MYDMHKCINLLCNVIFIPEFLRYRVVGKFDVSAHPHFLIILTDMTTRRMRLRAARGSVGFMRKQGCGVGLRE
jgi:hypothetical protein